MSRPTEPEPDSPEPPIQPPIEIPEPPIGELPASPCPPPPVTALPRRRVWIAEPPRAHRH